MKKQRSWKVVAIATALLAASNAVGQANRSDAIAEIPFAFTLASHTLQPGRYTVTRMSDTLFRISSSHNESVVVLATKVESGTPEDTAKLVFHRYGDSYFSRGTVGRG
jgi:hypothetical protein